MMNILHHNKEQSEDNTNYLSLVILFLRISLTERISATQEIKFMTLTPTA